MSKAKTFIATVKLTYKGESRHADIFEDGTAVLDSGERITLSDSQMQKIRQKKAEAEKKALALAQAAARKKREERAAAAVRPTPPPPPQDRQIRNTYAPKPEPEPYEDEPDYEEEYDYDIEETFEAMPRAGKINVKRIAISTLVYILVVGGTLFGAKYLLDNHMNKVSVAQFSTSMAKDAQITPDNLTRLKMSESIYRELEETTPGSLILWTDAQQAVGKYVKVDAVAGQYLTTDFLTDTRTIENPWIQALGDDDQLYTIKFDPYTTYNQLLFAGSHVRMKAVVLEMNEDGKLTGQSTVQSVSAAASGTVKTGEAEDADKSGSAPQGEAEGSTDESPEENQQNNSSSESEATDEASSEDDQADREETASEETGEYLGRDLDNGAVPDLFDDIVVVDIINATNESMFDIYLPLTRLTPEERRAYLTEKAQSEAAAQYRSRFTPTALVFALNDEQVSQLSKVEHMSNASITYTVLPSTVYDVTDEQKSMFSRFVEVQKDINEIFGDSIAAK